MWTFKTSVQRKELWAGQKTSVIPGENIYKIYKQPQSLHTEYMRSFYKINMVNNPTEK